MEEGTKSQRRGIGLRRVLAFLGRNRLAAIVLSVAFLTRLAYLVAYSGSPFFEVHIADALYHEQWARRILGGDIFSLKTPGVLYKAPLYPYFIAFAYLLSGSSNFFSMFLQVMMTATSCLLLFLIGRRYFGNPAAFVGALLYSFYFPSIYFSAEMEIPAVAIFLTLLSFYLLVRNPGTLSLVGSAVTLGLALLALPTNALLLPLYLFILGKRHGEAKRALRRAALFAAVVLATVFPCTLRNLIAGRHLTLISANGGMNLYIGNNEKYDETVYLQPGYAFEEFYDEPRRIRGVQAFADRDRYWYEKAFGFIFGHPGEETLLLLKKLVLYFADYEIYRNTDTYYAKEHSLYRHVPLVPASLLLATGLVGLSLAVRRRENRELVAFCLVQALPCLIFFVTDRYRLPSMGIWALGSGFFVLSIAKAFGTGAWRPGIAALVVAGCLAVVSNMNLFVVKNPPYRPHLNLGFIHETQGRYDMALGEYSAALERLQQSEPRDSKTESELYARLGNVHMTMNDFEAARRSLEQAVAVNPNSGPAYSYLGTLYGKQRQGELAVKMFRRALAINPWDVVSIHNLGLFYLNNNQLDEAMARFNRVLELAPEHSGAHNDLAYLYGKQGKYDLMESEAKAALYYDPESVAARYNLALLYRNTGRREEAIAQYRTITRVAPRESSNAYNELGVIFAEQGDLRKAIENWQKAVEIDPGNDSALANMQRARWMMR